MKTRLQIQSKQSATKLHGNTLDNNLEINISKILSENTSKTSFTQTIEITKSAFLTLVPR